MLWFCTVNLGSVAPGSGSQGAEMLLKTARWAAGAGRPQGERVGEWWGCSLSLKILSGGHSRPGEGRRLCEDVQVHKNQLSGRGGRWQADSFNKHGLRAVCIPHPISRNPECIKKERKQSSSPREAFLQLGRSRSKDT